MSKLTFYLIDVIIALNADIHVNRLANYHKQPVKR